MQISYLNREEIDDLQWNRCIDRAINGIVYAYTWYLDIVNPGWEALVSDDYAYVFPLPVSDYLGVDVLQQPFFTQQLGLFSGKHITPEILNEFVNSIPPKFRYININLNILNRYSGTIPFTSRVTYQLDLISSYSIIQKKYHQNTRRNNLKAYAMGISVIQNSSVDEFIEFFRANSAIKLDAVKYYQAERIASTTVSTGMGSIVGAYSNSKLCAVSLVVRSNGRIIYLLACSNPEGLERRAMFAIVDQIIRWNSESHFILDFEGSIIPSVARFYSGFGATPCYYQQLEKNLLPWYARFLHGIRRIVHSFPGSRHVAR